MKPLLIFQMIRTNFFLLSAVYGIMTSGKNAAAFFIVPPTKVRIEPSRAALWYNDVGEKRDSVFHCAANKGTHRTQPGGAMV